MLLRRSDLDDPGELHRPVLQASEMPDWPAEVEERAPLSAPRALVVLLVCLLTWSLLEAPDLKRAAEASPIGARRSTALALLGPLVAVSDATGLTALTDGVRRLVGRGPAGAREAIPPPEPLPTIGWTPEPPGRGGQGNPGEGNPGNEPVAEPQPEPVESGEPLRVPTPQRKLRVVIVGDSLSVGLSDALGRAMRPSLVRVVGQGRLSTGLARPDYFNWVGEMRRVVEAFRPDVVVVLMGSNDGQAIQLRDGTVLRTGTAEWAEAYRNQVARMMSASAGGGAHVAWITLPPMKEGWRHGWAKRLNGLYEREAAVNRSVDVIDAFQAYSRNGSYAAFLRRDGTVEQIREGDGVHFTARGYDRLAGLIVDHMLETWELVARATR